MFEVAEHGEQGVDGDGAGAVVAGDVEGDGDALEGFVVGSFGVDLGDCGSGGFVVDDGCFGGVGGDEGLDGDVVHGAGQSSCGFVDAGGGVVGEQGVGAPGFSELS